MSFQSKKVAFVTSGCRANQYDTAALEAILCRNDFEVVDFKEIADYYIINSCAITAQAETDAHAFSRKAIKANPLAKTLVTGCAAQTNSESFKENPHVHFIVGNDNKSSILDFLIKERQEEEDLPSFEYERHKEIFFEGGVTLPKHSRAFLKIQDGCSQFCSFCIVPFARGLNRSIPTDQIINSLFELKKKGVREAVLTGIHLGTYGKDLKPKTSLESLLQEIENKKPLPRIRLSSVDPEELSDSMIDLLAKSEVFCRHLHLPLQSGDDGVLKKMRRRYTSAYFEELCQKLIQKIPDLCIGTDVIVGFPGEDEKAFQNTKNLINRSPLAYVHTFPYSTRKGTKAANFSNQVSSKNKKLRSRIIREISDKKRLDFYRQSLGQSQEVILENRKNEFYGLTSNYISVKLDSEKEGLQAGHLAELRIISVEANRVLGRLVS